MSKKAAKSETNSELERTLFFEKQAESIARKFGARRITTHICSNRDEGQRQVITLINEELKKKGKLRIGISDSVTLHQTGIISKLEELDSVSIINPFIRLEDGKYEIFSDQPEGSLDLPKEEYYQRMQKHYDMMKDSVQSDIFLTGANAITMQGQIVSTDGTGNRVSGMIFGPEKVFVIVGRNKICKDLNAAMERNRNVAAPLNYFRHNVKHHNRFDNPCMKLGYCVDCNSPRRACLKTVIIDGEIELKKDRIHVILINEDLGL